jgi:SAM-dependent methyltransferase
MTSYLDDTRAAYDAAAIDYATMAKDALAGNPYDRSMLNLFAELVDGPVADLGCGPGRITTYLASLGLEAFGVDLSPRMVALARETYPELRFEVGSFFDLELPDNQLAGALLWYSLVHTPPEDLPKVFAEVRRVLAPGGLLLHVFKIGVGSKHLDQALGHQVSVDVYRHQPDDLAQLLTAAGFTEVAAFRSELIPPENDPQGYLLFRA